MPSASAPRGLPHRLNPSLCFECFVTADFNRFARASAWHVASNPGGGYNPLYVFSRTGLGKTHLLNAIGNHVLQQSPSTRVRLLAADQFLSDLAAARTQRALSSYLEECLRLDLLLFDDVHVLGGRTNSQKALVHLFDGFVESARQVVFTSNNTPRNIANLLPSLQSRLESGVLCEIGVPDEQAKYRIVMQKALAKGIRPSKDVALLLASSGNDFKTVAGYVTALEAHMSLTRRQVDLPTVRRLLKNRHSRDMGIADIQKLTAGYFNIPLSDLLSNKKSHRYSYPRQVAMYLARNLTQVSLNQIGQAFGKRDHTTVLYALKRIETARQKPDSGVSEDLGRIEAMFYA